MKFRGILAFAAMLAFAGTALVASAQENLTLYQGAQLNARMHSTLNTSNAHVGDRFVMDVVPPYPSGNPAFQGAVIAGEITSVTPAGQGRKPSLGLQFDYLRLADGSTVDIAASMTQDARKSETKNGLRTAVSTIGGMLLGNALGKTIFHTGGGGIIGAAGGFLYGINKKANFQLPAGSNVQITIDQTVTIRRQAPQSYQQQPPQSYQQPTQPPQSYQHPTPPPH
jgi:hypothetical protein